MTGCKGYGLRGSDARTEIEHTKEADTPGEIPGRSGLQADRRTGNKFIMRGAWLRSKEMEEIIMTLSMKEKKILYAYGCLSHHNTVTRLKWLTALTVDPEAKRRMLGLARKVETEMNESWYEDFYHHLRMEMDEYRRLKRSLRVLKSYTDYEEDLWKLSKYEKETIINWNEAENLASVYTFNASLKRRLADFSRKYPLLCRLERSTPEGSVTYVLDKSRLSIRLVPPYSEERKAAAREYAKEHGFQVVVTEEKIA